MTSSTDRIEKRVLLKASRARIWRALSNAEEFGDWFGVNLKGQTFAPGQETRGQITYPGFEHVVFTIRIERMEPERRLSFHWHPYAVDTKVDYAAEEPTLVVFELEEAPGGVLLTVVESGFDKVPAHRRTEAFRMNTGGWEEQMKNIARHVAA